AGAAPGDVSVIDVVGHAEVVERGKESPSDSVPEIVTIDEVLAAQGEQVAPVRPLRGRGKAEEKLRLEVVHQPPVGSGRGVMELVHDDVVESVRGEQAQVTRSAKGLDGGEEHIGFRGLLVATVETERGCRTDSSECSKSLS